MEGTDLPGAAAGDRAARAIEFLAVFLKATRMLRLYPARHPFVEKAFSEVRDLWARLPRFHALACHAADGVVAVDGACVARRPRPLAPLRRILDEKNLEAVAFHPEATQAEIREAASLLSRPSEEVLEGGTLRPLAVLALRHVRLHAAGAPAMAPWGIPPMPAGPDGSLRDRFQSEPEAALNLFRAAVALVLGRSDAPSPGEAAAAAAHVVEALADAVAESSAAPFDAVARTVSAAVDHLEPAVRDAVLRQTGARPLELLRRVSQTVKARLLLAEALRGDPEAQGFRLAAEALLDRPEEEEEIWPLLVSESGRPGVPLGSLARLARLLGREPAAPGGESPVVLVVEPDRAASDRAAHALRLDGFEVLEIAGAGAALERLREEGADLLVLEPKLGGMHGLELLSRLRRERRAPLPVVVHTAHEGFRTDLEIATHPRLRFLVKPASPEAIVLAARELLAGTPRSGGKARPVPAPASGGDLLPPRSVANRHFVVAGFEVATFFQPAPAQGSTYFDVFPHGVEETGLFLCDGLPREGPGAEALRAVREELPQLLRLEERPARVLSELNALLHNRFGGRPLASALYAVADPWRGELRISHAGAPGPLRFRPGAPPEELRLPSAVLLGFGKGRVFEASLRDTVVPLERGDLVLFYGRGVPAGPNPEDARLCREILSREVAGGLEADGATARAEALARRAGEALRPRQRPDGDLGLLLLRRVGGAEAAEGAVEGIEKPPLAAGEVA